MSSGWSYGCCKSIDNAACIECSDCGEWWHITLYNYRQSQLDSFAGDDEVWLCPSCFAGQEQGYCALDASMQSHHLQKKQIK